ncbi:MAG: hypothetical protein Q8M07_10025, partial [Prosthecobacter sp.]|nr:hypothetical protein [Prosthecobacter sp.]
MKRKSKKSVRQKGQAADLPRMPGLEFFKGLPALDDQTIVATVALIKLALANEFKSKLRTKKAADLL